MSRSRPHNNRIRHVPWRRLRRTATVLALTVLVPAGALLGASAPDAAAEPERDARIVTVLDASGSMKERDAGGKTRLAAAKDAVGQLVRDLPDGVSMGLRAYGSEYAGEDTGPGCRDTRKLTPVAPMDAAGKKAALAKVNKLKAVGMTPIGPALRAAARDAGDSGARRIVLVSDGEDTCAPPSVCTVAKELSGSGVNLVIDTVGFRVGAKARKQLQCIARATDGSYVDADDADELNDSMDTSVKEALTPYEPTGTPVRGGTTCAKAPLLSTGQFLDHFPEKGKRWYRIRMHPGQALRASASVVPKGDYGDVSFVRVNARLPGADTNMIMENAMESGWSTVVSTGKESERLDWDDIPKGKVTVDACVQAVNDVDTKDGGPQPVELELGLAGQAVDGSGDPVADTEAVADEGQGPSRGRVLDGDKATAERGGDAKAPGTSEGTSRSTGPTKKAADSSGSLRPVPVALAALAGALLAGILTPLVVRRRRSR